MLAGDGFRPGEDLFLQLNIFRGSLKDPVAPGQVVVINGSAEILPDALRLFRGQLPPGRALISISMDSADSPVQGFPADIYQHQA